MINVQNLKNVGNLESRLCIGEGTRYEIDCGDMYEHAELQLTLRDFQRDAARGRAVEHRVASLTNISKAFNVTGHSRHRKQLNLPTVRR